MTIEDAIQDRLADTTAVVARVGARIYRGWIPQRAGRPCITFQRISTTPVNGSTGPSGTQNIRIQVDVWALTPSEARAIATAVAGALSGWSRTSDPEIGRCNLVSDQDMTEPSDNGESKPEYRVSQDYSIWTTAS